MPLIPKPRTPDKESIPLRIERALNAELREYAQFVECSKDYVIDAALRRLFKHDKEFLAWREQRRTPHRSESVTVADSDPVLGVTVGDAAAQASDAAPSASESASERTARRTTLKERA